VAYLQKGDRAVALQKLQRAIELDPIHPTAHYAIALLYEQLGEAGEAERHFRRALSLKADYPEAHNAYGVFLCRQGRHDAAEQQFWLAIKNPLYSTPDLAYTNLGLCSLAKSDEAEKYFRRALELNPKEPGALLHMAALSFASKRYLQARGYLQRYQEVAPHTAESLWLAVRVERALGDGRTASDYAVQLQRKFPDSEQAQRLEGSD
jgi:type IV pilus assembly protein PilF